MKTLFLDEWADLGLKELNIDERDVIWQSYMVVPENDFEEELISNIIMGEFNKKMQSKKRNKSNRVVDSISVKHAVSGLYLVGWIFERSGNYEEQERYSYLMPNGQVANLNVA
tara:strand:+ start:1288 stop:1626 length:339 start_codon:yes stop_codon:yes gene_type:complete